MNKVTQGLLEKIEKWNALWNRNIGLPITREEAQEIRLALSSVAFRDVNARGAS
jgi:hypothetical protein